MSSYLYNFFYPSSICVAGASSKEKSIGYELLKSIKSYGYTGEIFPVNPKAENILGYPCYKTVEDISSKIDLAIVMVPKIYTEETIDLLLKKDVKSIILITAGFKETGKEGEEIEKKILEKVNKAGARLTGPNCMGVINTFDEIKLNATFVAEKPETGSTAFLSQSGAIGAAVLNSLRETDIKFGHFISVGNKADISENDLLSFWQSDDKIKTITMYLESFVNGEDFLKHFIDKKITKPVIILKAGKTSSGIKAASSHTGALGSNNRVVDSVLNQFGIIRVNDLNELFNSSKGFENFPVPKGNKVAVITNAGGPAILAVDSLDNEGLKLANFSDETKIKLREIVHPEGSINNPVDLLPGGTAGQFKNVNEIVLQDENVDAVVSIFVEPVMVPAFEVIEEINSIKSKKPLFQVVMPLPEFWEKYRKNSLTKKPLFKNPEDPSKVISNMLFFTKKKNYNLLKSGIPKINLSGEKAFLSDELIYKISKEYNLPVIPYQFFKKEEIDKKDINFNFPLVIKGKSKQIIHKSEINAVKINIKSGEEFSAAVKEIEDSFDDKNITLEGIIIQPFISGKFEILIGGFRDPSFGPVIMFGAGGKYVEYYNDTCLKSAYISDDDIDDIIDRTKTGKILKGVRGEKSINVDSLKKLIKSSAQMMLDNPEIIEFDFNPVIISNDDSFTIVDARLRC